MSAIVVHQNTKNASGRIDLSQSAHAYHTECRGLSLQE
jgi:hypothetical protein